MEQRDSIERSSSEAPPNSSSYAVNEKANIPGGPPNGPPLGSETSNISAPAQGASDLSPAVDNVLKSDVSVLFGQPDNHGNVLIKLDWRQYPSQSPQAKRCIGSRICDLSQEAIHA